MVPLVEIPDIIQHYAPNAIKLMHKCSYSLGLATLSLPPIVFPPDLLYEG